MVFTFGNEEVAGGKQKTKSKTKSNLLICLDLRLREGEHVKKFRLYFFYLFLSSVPASLLDLIPDDVELVSISIFFIIELPFPTADVVSGVESHGLVLIRQRCRGDGAINGTHKKKTMCYGYEQKPQKNK